MKSLRLMIEEITVRVSPRTAAIPHELLKTVAKQLKLPESEIHDIRILRRSIDARQKNIKINLKLSVASGNDQQAVQQIKFKEFKKVDKGAPSIVIVGAGPSGLFAALKAIELNIRPVIIERGEDVEKRRFKLASISRQGKLDSETNYCFGEGGAGAYSDGKLFTRSTKRGNVTEILQLLHQFGASEDILIDSHAHIGSDKLPGIIKNIRNTIIEKGGEVRFNEKMTDLIIEDGECKGIITGEGNEIRGAVILATGHSAKDVYRMLDRKNIKIEAKGLAMGVRVEHPQSLIDKILYHSPEGRGEFLPPAEYRFKERVDDRAVYSFCMCPGGVIVPSMSAEEESLVNGMSASARSGKWANSALVVEILPEDIKDDGSGELRILNLQQKLEKDFFLASGKTLKAPAQRLTDFLNGKESENLPASSYPAGLVSQRVDSLLPQFISSRLKEGIRRIDGKYSGFLTKDSTVVGLESRTSSPVRIPRDPVTLEHVEIKNLYPAGEGAGYAGGIVSSALDGQNAVVSFNKSLRTG